MSIRKNRQRGSISSKGLSSALLALTLLGAMLFGATSAQASFGFDEVGLEAIDSEGAPASQAGSHPAELTTTLEMNTETTAEGIVPEGSVKNLVVTQPEGLGGDPTVVPTCSQADFLAIHVSRNECPDATAVGYTKVNVAFSVIPPEEYEGRFHVPVYSLDPPPGTVAKFGFVALNVPVIIEVGIEGEAPYRLEAKVRNITQVVLFYGSKLTLWGVPADPSHDKFRGNCLKIEEATLEPESNGVCKTSMSERPFLTLPRNCRGPLEADFRAIPWESFLSEASASASAPQLIGCSDLGFSPSASATPTSRAAQSPTGLDFDLEVEDEGFADPDGVAQADIAKTELILPKGMTVNPSQAEGLEVCSEDDLGRETPTSGPGDGCPQASRIGDIELETPELPQTLLRGSLYVAEPYRNRAGDSLIALYIVIKDRRLGISVVQPVRVDPDPRTGQLVATAADMPEVPLSRVRLHLREGGRSPLITPPGCGKFETIAKLYPSSGQPPVISASNFQLVAGPNGSACRSGAAPFAPGFLAGTRNNAAGSFSPFDMRITRADGEQDITKFSAVLPPGVVARLAGTSWCPESGIARAKSRVGEAGGTEEKNDPSCPADSRIGTTSAGAGVGPQLAHVPGSLYLAGPYKGAPLSVVAITPAVAGPFDAGTVVVRVALTLNSVTGVAEVDGAASDPIPHILQGIPLNLRELQVKVDKPDFTLNATSCAELQAKATLFGGGTVLDPRPDTPVDLASRYQAASCASLAFAPHLAIRLYGGTRRGAFPALRAIVRPPAGQANFRRAVVTLPSSAFLEQGHIGTICTRVQFAAGAGHGSQCPARSVYGKAAAWSPLLDAPASGPVYLRSSSHNLPDLVVALKGPDSAPVDVELAARIDSVRGGIRSVFTGIPDVPVSRFVLAMQGGRKGLIVNSRNLCRKPGKNRARANLLGQNGRRLTIKPVIRAVKCAKQKRRKATRARASHRRAG